MAKYKNIAESEFPVPVACATLPLFARLSYALSDVSRLRTLLALKNGEQCVCRITELLKLAPSTVSKHMAVLREAGLVQSRKEGRWIYFRLPDEPRAPAIDGALALLTACTTCDPLVKDDRQRLRKICCKPAD